MKKQKLHTKIGNLQARVTFLEDQLAEAERENERIAEQLDQLRQFNPPEQARIRSLERARQVAGPGGIMGAFNGKAPPVDDLLKIANHIDGEGRE